MEVDAKSNPQIRNYSNASRRSCGDVGVRYNHPKIELTGGEDLIVELDKGVIRAREWASNVICMV
jgi:hypothetical protein